MLWPALLSCILNEPDVRFVAVCDVQRSRRLQTKEVVDNHYGNRDCAVYRDMFEVFGREDIDAVLIATPHYAQFASIDKLLDLPVVRVWPLIEHSGKDQVSILMCSDQALTVCLMHRDGLLYQHVVP